MSCVSVRWVVRWLVWDELCELSCVSWVWVELWNALCEMSCMRLIVWEIVRDVSWVVWEMSSVRDELCERWVVSVWDEMWDEIVSWVVCDELWDELCERWGGGDGGGEEEKEAAGCRAKNKNPTQFTWGKKKRKKCAPLEKSWALLRIIFGINPLKNDVSRVVGYFSTMESVSTYLIWDLLAISQDLASPSRCGSK